MARKIDLNAARAARAEARGEPVTVELGDDVYELPAEMPASVLGLIAGAMDGNPAVAIDVIRVLVGDSYDEMVSKHALTIDDLMELLGAASEQYGLTVGESLASPASSDTIGTPPRPTSPASTASTSAKSSSARS